MDDALPSANAERGPWSTGLATLVALLPLTIALAAVVAADRKLAIGPAGPNQLVYWVALPLGALYPTVAALARRMAYAPLTVLVTAAMAPALAYATWLLLQPLPKDELGRSVITPTTVANMALPPAVLAAGAFVAIELASAAMRRGVAVGVFGAITAALVFAAAIAAPVLLGPVSLG
jgi:hypothetical protein